MTPDVENEDLLGRDEVLNAIEEMIEDGDLDAAIAWCDTHLIRFPADPEAFILKGHAMAELGEFEQALFYYEQASSLVPDWEDAALTRAGVLLELNRIDEARELLAPLCERYPDNAHIHYMSAITFDLLGNELGAQRHYRIAAEHHSHYHLPYRVSSAAFEQSAQIALARVCTELEIDSNNLTVVVANHPNTAVLDRNGAALSPLTLGYCTGAPDNSDGVADFPSVVFLFKKNLERVSTGRTDLKEQLALTLRHELCQLAEGVNRSLQFQNGF